MTTRNRHLASSVIILTLVSVFSIGIADEPLDEGITSVGQFGIWLSNDPIYWMMDAFFGLLASSVLIIMNFLIGKKLGGISNFKKIFVAISPHHFQ